MESPSQSILYNGKYLTAPAIFSHRSSSSIQTLLSAPESHRIMPFGSRAVPPVGITPCPEDIL